MEIAGIGDTVSTRTRGVASLQMRSQHDIGFTLKVNAFILTTITVELPTRKLHTEKWEHLRGIELSDPNFGNPGRIDMLIGADVWGSILKEGIINGTDSTPHAQNTHLGWVVSGPVSLAHCNLIHCLHTHMDGGIEYNLTRFWELEEPSMAITNQVENECERQYRETVRRQADGRYIVHIPFLSGQPKLGDSRRMATQQFYRMEKRMHRDPELLRKYVAFMREYEQLGHMVICSDNNDDDGGAYYIPHHAVSVDVKFRVVFNASAQSTNGVSLNDTQHNGPTIQDRLANIILRFRRYEVAVVADVEKMFRQVQVAAEHQPWQSIVWRENPTEELKTYRLTTVTYGTRSGPYLAVRSLVQCARDNYGVVKNIDLANQALQSIEQDFYVDDYLSSAPTRADSIRLSRNVDRILQQGHFRLRKWKSNDPSVVQAIKGENESGKCPLPIDSTEYQYWTHYRSTSH